MMSILCEVSIQLNTATLLNNDPYHYNNDWGKYRIRTNIGEKLYLANW